MELEACVRHNVPIIVVVANNQGNNGAIKQQAMFPPQAERVAMFQPGLQYDRLMTMFGGVGSTVSRPDQLRHAMSAALRSGRPACINVTIDPHAPITNAWGEQQVDEF